MAIETQNVEILFEGLEQKTDSKILKAGKLTRAQNVEFDKGGTLNKRRGFRRYRFDGSPQIGALGTTMETQAFRVATFRDELLIFGVSWLWSISKADLATSAHAVRRGRLSPGNLRVVHVATATESEDG